MKIGILISGRGSNMVALVDAVKSGEIPDSEVAVVISDKAEAAGLAKASERGVETVVVERRGRTREEHDAEIIQELRKRDVELVCLAGYMRLLSRDFVEAYDDGIVNIHPSLLPKFRGLDAQKQALEAGVWMTGCTVHFVNEDLDAGRIILQKNVLVEKGDTVESLSTRILREEHLAYVEALRRIVVGRSGISPRPDYTSERTRHLIEILDIGHETSMRGEGISLREALRRTAYNERRPLFKSSDLLPIIRHRPNYVYEWLGFSEDKRTSGGFWLMDDPPGIGNLKTREKFSYLTMEEAVAEYVVHELDYWAAVGH